MTIRNKPATGWAAKSIFWSAGIALTGLLGFSVYEGIRASDAVASESEQSSFEIRQENTQSASVDSILSDTDSYCAVATNNGVNSGILITERASLTANGCFVHANARTKKAVGLYVDRDGTLDARAVHSNGKLEDKSEERNPEVFESSERMTDPLSYVQAPEHKECDYRNHPVRIGENSLKPGVYCGGIIALGDSKITLEPGNYIIKNGPLVLGGKVSMQGEHVSFYFTGSNAVLNLGVASKISVSAPIEGPQAGILFFEDREGTPNNEFTIRSGNAQKLEGAIYLPRGRFVGEASARIGGEANWTALIANKIELRNASSLVLNSNYSASDIPVPEGIWPGLSVASSSN